MEEKEPILSAPETEEKDSSLEEVEELLNTGKRKKDALKRKIEYVDFDNIELEDSNIVAQQQALKSKVRLLHPLKRIRQYMERQHSD